MVPRNSTRLTLPSTTVVTVALPISRGKNSSTGYERYTVVSAAPHRVRLDDNTKRTSAPDGTRLSASTSPAPQTRNPQRRRVSQTCVRSSKEAEQGRRWGGGAGEGTHFLLALVDRGGGVQFGTRRIVPTIGCRGAGIGDREGGGGGVAACTPPPSGTHATSLSLPETTDSSRASQPFRAMVAFL